MIFGSLARLQVSRRCISYLPKDNILDAIKLNAFADDKVNVAQMMISLCNIVENTVGEKEKCW